MNGTIEPSLNSTSQFSPAVKTKSLNHSFAAAKASKQDEFYTQLSDIERELKHYKKHFKGKTVYCNCDDPRVSNFFHCLSYNFEQLSLKKIRPRIMSLAFS